MNLPYLEYLLRPMVKREIVGAEGKPTFVISDESGAVQSQVSERYTLVQNRDLLAPFVARFGVQAFEKAYMTKRGASSFLIRTGREIDVGDGDVVREQLLVTNSYNKSKSFSFIFGAFRLICSNGLFTGAVTMNFRKIHVGDIPVADMVRHVIEHFEENTFDLWRKMKTVASSVAEQVAFVSTLKIFDETPDPATPWKITPAQKMNSAIRQTARYRLSLPESRDNQRNVWGVFNAVNRGIVRAVSPRDFVRNALAHRRAESLISAAFLNR